MHTIEKFIKNVSGSTITLPSLGIEVANNDYIEVTVPLYENVLDNEALFELIRNEDIQIGYSSTGYFTNPIDGEVYLRSNFDNYAYIGKDGEGIETFSPTIVQDPTTEKKATTLFMNILTMMKELYNDSSNPLYDVNFQKLIGGGGREAEHISRTANLENIHAKRGWHREESKSWGIQKPFNLLIYYGWLNSFNSSQNGWYNEKVAQDIAKYNLIILGDGIQNPSHGDYSNTSIIIPRIKALNPDCKIFGYVSVNQAINDFETKVDQWEDLSIDGIFLDEAGYDYGKTRGEFNTRVDYVHSNTSAKLCFANSWNLDHILGTTNDTSYPNSTYNSGVIESTLTENDWILLESFPINTTAYSGNNGYESKSDWASRGLSALTKRYTYGINIAACGIIDNSGGSQSLFDFLYISACMFAIEAVGSSDTSYGASSAAVNFWVRPDIKEIGRLWVISPSVQNDVLDNDVYHRYTDFAKFLLDFSSGAESSSITKF